METSYVSGDFICSLMTKQFNFTNRERFLEHLKSTQKLDNATLYLQELIEWVLDRTKIWQSAMENSLSRKDEDKKLSGFNLTFSKGDSFKNSNQKGKSNFEFSDETNAKMGFF